MKRIQCFDDARMKFDVRFYLVAILFIIFRSRSGVPVSVGGRFGKLGVTGFWSMMGSSPCSRWFCLRMEERRARMD